MRTVSLAARARRLCSWRSLREAPGVPGLARALLKASLSYRVEALRGWQLPPPLAPVRRVRSGAALSRAGEPSWRALSATSDDENSALPSTSPGDSGLRSVEQLCAAARAETADTRYSLQHWGAACLPFGWAAKSAPVCDLDSIADPQRARLQHGGVLAKRHTLQLPVPAQLPEGR